MHLNGLQFSSALEEFSISSLFLASKMQKINFLKKISVKFSFFIKLKGEMITNLSS